MTSQTNQKVIIVFLELNLANDISNYRKTFNFRNGGMIQIHLNKHFTFTFFELISVSSHYIHEWC